MVKKDLEIVRDKLNYLIEFECGYDEIYNASVELDKLILEFYRNQKSMMI